MIAANSPISPKFARSSVRVAALLIFFGLAATIFYLPSSATSFRKVGEPRTPSTRDKSKSPARARTTRSGSSSLIKKDFDLSSLMAPPLFLEGIATFAYPACTVPKDSFNLGETVCAKASGVPATVFPWQVTWVNSANVIVQSAVADTNDEHQYIFTLSSSPSAVGTWRVNLVRSNGAVRQSASFTVHNTVAPSADVLVQKIVRDGDATVGVGGSIAFQVLVTNAGPDPAVSVNLIDTAPVGSTLASFTQQTGPACLPALAANCTISSLNYRETAEFTAVYQIGGSPGTQETSARVTSTTTDPDSGNNNSFAQFEVAAGAGGTPCTLVCATGISRAAIGNTGHYVMTSSEFNSNLTPVATGGTCGAITKSVSPDLSGNYTFPIGTSVITFETASGETCTTTVTVTDSQAPTISCPSSITTFESPAGSGSATVNFNVSTTDDSGSATVNCNYPSGTNFPVGTTAVICSATDGTNTSASCTFNVTVNAVGGGEDCVLTPPASIVEDSPDNACGKAVTFTVGATDCGTVTCDRQSGSFFPVGETLVTCTSSPDGTSTSFTVTVNDVTDPVPTLGSLPTLSQTCSVTAGVPTTIITPTGPKVVIELPTATDNCGGLISGSTDERTFDEPGSHVVTWTFTDTSGNSSTQTQTVIVTGNDTTAPVPDVATLTATGECEVTVTAPTATDNCAGTVTGTTPDPLTYTGVGTYIVHWTYTDGSSNSSTQNQTVVVTDETDPTIALVGASSITVECHTSFSDPGVTTTDNCVPKNVNVTTTGSVNINVPDTYTITYTATDAGGNDVSVQRTVIVEDTTPPTISCPSNITVYLPVNSSATSTAVLYTTPVGSDSCGPATTVQTAGLASGAQFPVGTTENIFTVTDGANHSVSCSFTVTVLYNFTGFFSPVNNPPTLNSVNAGRNIPVKFSLSGNKGLNIFAANNPFSSSLNCNTNDPGVDMVETNNPGQSTLTYSPDTYHYNWKTESSWAGTCRQLVITLNDGTVHFANFKFK